MRSRKHNVRTSAPAPGKKPASRSRRRKATTAATAQHTFNRILAFRHAVGSGARHLHLLPRQHHAHLPARHVLDALGHLHARTHARTTTAPQAPALHAPSNHHTTSSQPAAPRRSARRAAVPAPQKKRRVAHLPVVAGCQQHVHVARAHRRVRQHVGALPVRAQHRHAARRHLLVPCARARTHAHTHAHPHRLGVALPSLVGEPSAQRFPPDTNQRAGHAGVRRRAPATHLRCCRRPARWARGTCGTAPPPAWRGGAARPARRPTARPRRGSPPASRRCPPAGAGCAHARTHKHTCVHQQNRLRHRQSTASGSAIELERWWQWWWRSCACHRAARPHGADACAHQSTSRALLTRAQARRAAAPAARRPCRGSPPR